MLRLVIIAIVALTAASASAQQPPALGLPIACSLGDTCWPINYPDVDPGPGAADFQCRARSYQNHDGIDFAIRDRTVMAAGIPVLAAASGVVQGVRDGQPDGAHLLGQGVQGKECGNGVMIRHDDGWTTQYCHLRRGSVTVRSGHRVERGDRLGMVGLSGLSEFPHVHLTVRHHDKAVDPFTGEELAAGCGRPARPLWAADLPYQPVSLYAAGFADHMPAADEVKADAAGAATLGTQKPLVLWAAAFGVVPADHVTLALHGPNGTELVARTVTIKRAQAWRMETLGRKAPAGGWPKGRYRGEVRFERAGLPPVARPVAVELR